MSDFPVDPPPEPYHGLSARLVVQRGPAPDKQYEVTAVTSTIGRSPNSDVVINDPEVSRRHAHILQQQNGFAVEDLGSTNGTFVNGQRCVGVTLLKDGDMIDLGDTISLQFGLNAAVPGANMVLSDEDTADLPPIQPPAPRSPARANVAVEPSLDVAAPDEQTGGRTKRVVLGCGLALILTICCCGAVAIFLDSYEQGHYLYCAGLRPLWDVILGPLGFSPACP